VLDKNIHSTLISLPSFLSALQAVASDYDSVGHQISNSQIGMYNIVGKPY